MKWYSTEPRTRKYVKGYGFLSFARKYRKQLMDNGLDALKTAFKKVVHKTRQFLGERITDKIVKPKHVIDENTKKSWRNNYSTRKKRRNIKWIKTSIIKMEHYKISKLLNDSTVSKLVKKNMDHSKLFIKWSIFC